MKRRGRSNQNTVRNAISNSSRAKNAMEIELHVHTYIRAPGEVDRKRISAFVGGEKKFSAKIVRKCPPGETLSTRGHG